MTKKKPIDKNKVDQLPTNGLMYHSKAASTPEEPRQLPKNLISNFNQVAEVKLEEQLASDMLSLVTRIQTLEHSLKQTNEHFIAQETSIKAHIMVLEERLSAVERLQQHHRQQGNFIDSTVNSSGLDMFNTKKSMWKNHPTTACFIPLFTNKKLHNLEIENSSRKGPPSPLKRTTCHPIDNLRGSLINDKKLEEVASFDSQNVLLSLRSRFNEAQTVLEAARTLLMQSDNNLPPP